MTQEIEDVLTFWESEVSEKNWYSVDKKLDEKITSRFHSLWQQAAAGDLRNWQLTARGCLALIILTDQFPRNMFRGTDQSFATDSMALCLAKKAIQQGLDVKVACPIRQFFYLPLMHSESSMDQDYAVRMFLIRMPDSVHLLHARAHRQVIRDYGRFPFRNDALKRISSEEEVQYLKAGGYMATVKSLA